MTTLSYAQVIDLLERCAAQPVPDLNTVDWALARERHACADGETARCERWGR